MKHSADRSGGKRQRLTVQKIIRESTHQKMHRKTLLCQVNNHPESEEINFETELEFAKGWKSGHKTIFHGKVTKDGLQWQATLRLPNSPKSGTLGSL